jgi:hypothetical protein
MSIRGVCSVRAGGSTREVICWLVNSQRFRRECLKADKTKPNRERTNRMINTLNQSIGLPRLTRTKFLSIIAASALVLTATFLRADSGRNESEHNNTLAGTWVSTDPGVGIVVSFLSDGRMNYTIPLTLLSGNGPGGSSELAAPALGEWRRTGGHEFVSTAYSPLSSPTVSFTHLVKLNNTFTLNDTTDELTQPAGGIISVYFPDGTLQFSFPGGGVVHYKRIVAGQ